MSEVSWAGTSICPKCKRMVKHKPYGGPHRRHGCRIRWIKRRVERRYFEGWYEGYEFALENISDPMVRADLNDYGTGWAGLAERGGITIDAHDEPEHPEDSTTYDEDGPGQPLTVLCNSCGRALANVGEWCCNRYTRAADVTTIGGPS